MSILTEFLPFSFDLNPIAIAGASLWALGLYLGLFSFREWVIQQLQRWFNFAERSLYSSAEEFERTRSAREAQNAFYASFCSIIPFLLLGVLCNLGIELALGPDWGISLGVLTCVACGVYELGRSNSS